MADVRSVREPAVTPLVGRGSVGWVHGWYRTARLVAGARWSVVPRADGSGSALPDRLQPVLGLVRINLARRAEGTFSP